MDLTLRERFLYGSIILGVVLAGFFGVWAALTVIGETGRKVVAGGLIVLMVYGAIWPTSKAINRK